MIDLLETLDDATLVLGEEYREWKDHEKNKDDAKAQFFNNVVEEILRQVEEGEITLRTKIAEITVATLDPSLAELRLKMKNPRFVIKSLRPRVSEDESWEGPFTFEAILEEDPFYLPFYHVNLDDGFKYERRCDDGAIMLDDDRLKEDDPGLYKRVMFELPWGDYVPIPTEKLDSKDQLAIRDYLYQKEPTIKLPAPRKASDEELEEAANRG